MFTQLVESKRNRKKSGVGPVASVALHSLVIGFAVWATANAATQAIEPRSEQLTYAMPPKDEPLPPPQARTVRSQARATGAVAAPPPLGVSLPPTSFDIPNVIPDIDVMRGRSVDPGLPGKGVSGTPWGTVDGTGTGSKLGTNYLVYDVENPAALDERRSPKPTYPAVLRNAGITDTVRIRFVVDTTGRADMSTFHVLGAKNEMFVNAVRAVLPRMRFYPAQTGGRHVRQIVEMPFSFYLER